MKMQARTASLSLARDLAEAARLIIVERLLQFLDRVHHEWSVSRNRFFERDAREDERFKTVRAAPRMERRRRTLENRCLMLANVFAFNRRGARNCMDDRIRSLRN